MKVKYYTTTGIRRPIYRYKNARFVNGLFFTDDKATQDMLEKSPVFNVDFRLAKEKEIADEYGIINEPAEPKRGKKATVKNDIEGS